MNGVAVTVPNQTLTAGGEYTLLVWSNADGTQTTLISDDNRLPSSSSKAKVRIMNGLSALSVPVTLFVNFFPQLENIPLGQASAFAEVDRGDAAGVRRLHAFHVVERRYGQRDAAEGSVRAGRSRRINAFSLSTASVSMSPTTVSRYAPGCRRAAST